MTSKILVAALAFTVATVFSGAASTAKQVQGVLADSAVRQNVNFEYGKLHGHGESKYGNVSEKDGFGTLAVHAGQAPDLATGAVIPSLSLSTTYVQSASGVHKGFTYSRSGNPTRKAFETAMAALEGGKYALAFASGSATTSTVAYLANAGSHIVSVNDVYGGMITYLTKIAPNNGVEVTFANLENPENLRKALKANTKVVWIESPTNPTLRLVDIAAVAKITHEVPGRLLVVDNTFLSPVFQRPLDFGADIIVHSVTKYLNGHSDVIMGVAITNDESLFKSLKLYQSVVGGVPSPFDCYLAHRGLKTLHIRMQKHEQNAFAISSYLQSSPYVQDVIYTGLESHPQHELAKRQQTGHGGMVSFRIKNAGISEADTFLQNLRLFALAESLGGVESLAELPAVMTHCNLSQEKRLELGITDNLIRLSVGIEDAEDLIKDLEQALKIASASGTKI
ncbi:hypothetical protein SeLEV6574_g04474 [Synchytrium endobioticum]|nr:hypothetical protein SeLEV6574_g04474 [Synchytrium endobioticum]